MQSQRKLRNLPASRHPQLISVEVKRMFIVIRHGAAPGLTYAPDQICNNKHHPGNDQQFFTVVFIGSTPTGIHVVMCVCMYQRYIHFTPPDIWHMPNFFHTSLLVHMAFNLISRLIPFIRPEVSARIILERLTAITSRNRPARFRHKIHLLSLFI